jgi:hypothetical protein
LRVAPELPYSEACERNKGPILGGIRPLLTRPAHLVEIGAGTGQHAVHFARALPHVSWQPTDRVEYLPGLAARISAEGPPNLLAPLELDVEWSRWPVDDVDAIYTANTLHIMSWPEVVALMRGIGIVARPDALLMIYGPFRYAGRYTSDSNAHFDAMLRERDPASGLRDIEAVVTLGEAQGFRLDLDLQMPANNQLLILRRKRSGIM